MMNAAACAVVQAAQRTAAKRVTDGVIIESKSRGEGRERPGMADCHLLMGVCK